MSKPQCRADESRDIAPWADVQRGDVVQALRLLDPEGANVLPGTFGVVNECADAFRDWAGPHVAWMTGSMCAVYAGDVVCVVSAKQHADAMRASFGYRTSRKRRA